MLLALAAAACRKPESAGKDGGTEHPQRIVSQTVLSDEILWELGDDVRARVAGVSSMADDTRYSRIAGSWPNTIERVPSTAEHILAHQPDLAIIGSFTSAETRILLEQTGVPLIVLSAFDDFDDYRANVHEVARAVGDIEGGESIVFEFDRELAELSSSSTAPPSVVSWSEGTVAGRETTFDAEARAAGLRNLASEHEIFGHAQVGVERVVAWDPDWLVISCKTSCSKALTEIRDEPGLSAIRAVRDHRVIAIEPRALFATGRGMLEVVRVLADHVRGAR